jgi:transposase
MNSGKLLPDQGPLEVPVSYRRHDPPAPLLFGYDPFRDLPLDHLARLVEAVVEETVVPPRREPRPGQPPYDPRLCVKVLVYSYCTGVRSSRVMERHCRESLPYLFLTRGAAPSYHTLCTARTEQGAFLEAVWEGLFAVAATVGLERLGRITVDSTKIRANASPEAVIKREEFAAVRAELERIQAEVARIDAQEAVEGSAGRTQLGRTVPQEHMRDILRRVRWQRQKEARKAPTTRPSEDEGSNGGEGGRPGGPGEGGSQEAILPLEAVPEPTPPAEPHPAPTPMSAKMLQRVAAGIKALQEAEADGRKHLCLTDPDARMMYGERDRGTRECHSFEVAVDNGLLVVARASQEPNDNACLGPLVEAARQHEPNGVQAVDGDSGYYTGETVAALIREGIDTCIPDSHTAADLHRGQPIGTTRAKARGSVPFTYDPEADTYHCPEGNTLARTQHRRQDGQQLTVYRAQESCVECPQVAACVTQPNAKHRTLKVGDDQALLETARERFRDPKHQDRYRHRGARVETVFGFVRGTLGFVRWVLRGTEKVEREAKLFKTAYQFRKIHRAWVT